MSHGEWRFSLDKQAKRVSDNLDSSEATSVILLLATSSRARLIPICLSSLGSEKLRSALITFSSRLLQLSTAISQKGSGANQV
jgi:hypothetical protein